MVWRNRPNYINYCPPEADYALFLDENGNDSLKGILKKQDEHEGKQEYFTVTGIAVKSQDLQYIKEEIMALKHKHWENACFFYNKQLKRICFHSRDIRKKQGPFNPAIIDIEQLLGDLNNLVSNIPITIFSSSIEKVEHCRRYANPEHPYNLCLGFILERFTKYFMSLQNISILVLEARGKKEDRNVLNFIKKLLDTETKYVNNATFKQKIMGVYFNNKWSKNDDYLKTYFCLELADLVSYPIYKLIRHGIKDKAFKCLENKIYGYPNYWGKGIKVFPPDK